ncbi:hypothetical protein Tco_1522639 [Tanacetum coccineum]
MQYSFNQSTPKSSSQPEGEHIKKDKGKKALSLEEAEKESSDSDSNNDETHHIHLPEEKINQQKKIEEEAKAEAAKRETEFQTFIDSKFTLDYDSQMTNTYFVEYTRLEVQHFRDTLLQHLESIRTDSIVQDDSSRSGNDTDADDADIRPIYDEEPMAE